MSEANVWNKLRTNMLRGRWLEATRHEDKLQKGIADVSFVQDVIYQIEYPDGFNGLVSDSRRIAIHGWMELKWVADWPKRDTTKVPFPHFTADQRGWLQQKGKAGGNTWVFAQIGGDHILVNWDQCHLIGVTDRPTLLEHSHAAWVGRRLDYDELAEAIAQGAV